MNESGKNIIAIIKDMQRARAVNSFLTFAAGGGLTLAAFILGRLTSG